MMDFFGLRPGQTVILFGAELKALSLGEKKEVAQGLRSIGVDCADPVPPKVA
jgi:hypothetical protein